jgi:hypothetical protein
MVVEMVLPIEVMVVKPLVRHLDKVEMVVMADPV